MGTKFNIIYEKGNRLKSEPAFGGDFYFEDTPFEILKILGPEYRIGGYKNLDTISSQILFKDQIVKGIGVEEFSDSSINFNEKFKDFDLQMIDFLKNKYFDKDVSMKYIISKYLIDKKIENPGSSIGVGRVSHVNKMGQYRIINNLFERGEKAEELRETYLNNILEYGSAIFGEFSKKDLEMLTLEVIKHIPKEFTPAPKEFYIRPPKSLFRKK